MNTVYIETSILSHATARPSRDIQTAALQQQARDWWRIERPNFNLVTSQLTLDEASRGDQNAAIERLKLLDGIPLLDIDSDSQALANLILSGHMMPQKAAADALHIAVAATNLIPYLLTWNCRHLANATMRPVIEAVCIAKGLKAPIICTPEELMEAKP